MVCWFYGLSFERTYIVRGVRIVKPAKGQKPTVGTMNLTVKRYQTRFLYLGITSIAASCSDARWMRSGEFQGSYVFVLCMGCRLFAPPRPPQSAARHSIASPRCLLTRTPGFCLASVFRTFPMNLFIACPVPISRR